ncbi:MAG: hypothetical protein R2879_22215 [Saprospiraceae bacterium]
MHFFLLSYLLLWISGSPHYSYFPDGKLISDGIVNKYYVSTFSKDGLTEYATIEYRKYEKDDRGNLIEERFNPAMEPVSRMVQKESDEGIRLIENYFLFRKDTIHYEIPDANLIFPSGKQTAKSEVSFTYAGGYHRVFNQEASWLRDTSAANRNGFVLQRKRRIVTHKPDGVVDSTFAVMEDVFLEGIGLYSYEGSDEKNRYQLELVEQFTLEDFEKMQNHGIKRIGYIHPENNLDGKGSFLPCGPEDEIADYYNGQLNRAEFKGGKIAIWNFVKPRMNLENWPKASGYLTLRFVINCNGEAGRFTTDEADLDFNPKQFDDDLVNHFYKILKENKDWSPCIIRGENRDAYTYITFKLKDGKLIEILP